MSNQISAANIVAAYFGHGEPEVSHATISTVNTDWQIAIAPHPAPAYGYLRVLYYTFSNPSAGIGVVKIWDEDLTTNTTALQRGSVTDPLHQFNVQINADLYVVPTPEFFQAGIVAQSDADELHVSAFYAKFLG